MLKHVKKNKAKIKKVLYCTHRSDHGCDCRKPEIGNIVKGLAAINKSPRHANKAFFVGDTESDIQAGKNAGCKTIFVLSGRETRKTIRKWDVRPDYIVKDLLAATKIMQNENSNHSRLRGRRTHKSR